MSDHNPSTDPPPPSTGRAGFTLGGAGGLPLDYSFFFVIDEGVREYDKASRDYLREMRETQQQNNLAQSDFIFVNAIIFNPAGCMLMVRPQKEKVSAVEPRRRYTLPGGWCQCDSTKLLTYLAQALWDHVRLRTTRVRRRHYTETWRYQESGMSRLTQTLTMSFVVEVEDTGALFLGGTNKYCQHLWVTEDEVRTGFRHSGGVQQNTVLRFASNTMRLLLPLAFTMRRAEQQNGQQQNGQQNGQPNGQPYGQPNGQPNGQQNGHAS